MITAKQQAETDQAIMEACKKLFFTTAIPEMCKTEGTPRQIEYLKDALLREVARREENKKTRLIKQFVCQFFRRNATSDKQNIYYFSSAICCTHALPPFCKFSNLIVKNELEKTFHIKTGFFPQPLLTQSTQLIQK